MLSPCQPETFSAALGPAAGDIDVQLGQHREQVKRHTAIRVPPRRPVERVPNVLSPLSRLTDRKDERRLLSRLFSNLTRDGGRRDRHGVACGGCALTFPSAFARDIHLRKSGACIKCHLHNADHSPEHQHTCGGMIASSLGLGAPSSQPSLSSTQTHQKSPVVGSFDSNTQFLLSQQNLPMMFLPPVESTADFRSGSLTTYPTLIPAISFTPEPDPPPITQIPQPPQRQPTVSQCLACPAILPSLSASLKHLASAECPARLTAPRVAKLQSAWYPWESATIVDVDARTTDFEMSYFCPTCGACFGSVAGAVAHMEQAADAGGKENRGQEESEDGGKASVGCSGSGSSTTPRDHAPPGKTPSPDEAEHDRCCRSRHIHRSAHADALCALDAGLRRLRRQFHWARRADGIVDVLAKRYTPYACFSELATPQQLQALAQISENAKRALGGVPTVGRAKI